jgi:hypothetical protein
VGSSSKGVVGVVAQTVVAKKEATYLPMTSADSCVDSVRFPSSVVGNVGHGLFISPTADYLEQERWVLRNVV